MEKSEVRKTRHPDHSPIVSEILSLRFERVQQTIRACQEAIRTAREVRDETAKTRARAKQLRKRSSFTP